jgi:hypothetical protein
MVEPLLRWGTVLVAGAFGLVFALLGLANLNALRAVTFTSVTAPGRVRPGLAEVVARVQPAGEPVTAPLSGTECVGYVLGESVRGRDYRSLFGLRWREARLVEDLHPFDLADGSGHIHVDPTLEGSWPDGSPSELFSDLELSVDARETFDAEAPLPDALAAVVATEDLHGGVTERRFTEWRIEEDDQLYVLGRARETGEEEPLAIVNDAGPFVLSETPQWRTALRRLLRALAFLLVGAGMLSVAVLRAGLV